jgi:hypothetical protein
MKVLIVLFLSFYSNTSISACDLTISPGQDIQASLNAIGANKTLCLNAGIFTSNSSITLKSGQRLTGVSGNVAGLLTTIQSSADRIISMNDNSQIDNFNLKSMTGSLATFGVLTYFDVNPKIWNLNITHVKIGIGVNGSTGTQLLNNYLSLNGDLNNGIPDPSIWITNTVNTKLWYGYIVGRDNGVPGSQGFLIGDGEVSCYNSVGLTITGTRHDKSGTSSFYLVNCDNATLDEVNVFYSNGFGLDIVDGTDNLVVKNSKVYFSKLAASVFDELENNSGTFMNNLFYNNNTSGQSNCAGITVIGNPSKITLVGNTAIPSPLTCLY